LLFGSIEAKFRRFIEKIFFTYDVVFLLTALENKHLLPKRHKGAFLGYPASETCITEPGRGEKGIPKSGNDSNIGPVPRVTEERSERARSITLPPISENQWLQNVGLRRGLRNPSTSRNLRTGGPTLMLKDWWLLSST